MAGAGGEIDGGILLDGSNIDETIDRMRAGRRAWRQAHPADVAEIEAMALEPENPVRDRIAEKRLRP